MPIGDPEVGDLIRCNPDTYRGHEEFKEWQTIVAIDSEYYYISGPGVARTSGGRWDKAFNQYQFIYDMTQQSI